MTRIAKIAGLVGGSLLVVAGVATATAAAAGVNFRPEAAQTPIPSATPTAPVQNGAYCQDYLAHLAKDLGVSQDKLGSAIKNAGAQTVDDAVANGTITRKQAGTIKSKLSAGTSCASAVTGLGQHGQDAEAARAVLVQAAAKALGITSGQLTTDLEQGKTVSQIAPQGMTEDQFTSAVQANVKSDLDGMVTAGKVTQIQEDAAMRAVPKLAQQLWTNGAPRAGRRPIHASPSPSPSVGS
jgi:hypothetical protein